MAHEIHAVVVLKLPEEAQAMAQGVASFAGAWAEMLQKAGGAAAISHFTVTEEAVVRVRKRGPRKRRLHITPGNGDAMAAADEFLRQAAAAP